MDYRCCHTNQKGKRTYWVGKIENLQLHEKGYEAEVCGRSSNFYIIVGESNRDFDNDTVTGDMTLYAKWTELSEPTEPSEPTKPVQPTEPTEPSAPQTGDNNNMMPWVCLFIISLIILGCIVCLQKKFLKIK